MSTIPPIDVLTSPTLKDLRERWWNPEFAEFLMETLRPRPGNRILGIGCGEGVAEVSLRRLQISQLKLHGVDLVPAKLVAARRTVAGHNYRVSFTAGDVCALPFADAAFDAVYAVAVLQHVFDLESAVRECTRVTRPGGRVVVVEPDNAARYFYSSVPAGARAFDTARAFYAGLAAARGETGDGVVGPVLPGLFARHGVTPVDVRLFPVSATWLGDRGADAWGERRAAVRRRAALAPTDAVQALGAAHEAALASYEAEAQAAGPAFVEMQHTMLFATVGERED